ncbi:unnamed protein product [Lathyrus sativus]|nr:unnamed protein product [Lathyrus sativus]
MRGRDGFIYRRYSEGRSTREEDRIAALVHISPHPPFPGGPSDMSLLVSYQNHVVRHLWGGQERSSKKELKVVAHGSKFIGWVPYSPPPVNE